MKIIFTKHALEKLKTAEVKSLGVTKAKIIDALFKPIIVDKSLFPHRNVGKLSEKLSLCVIYRFEKDAIILITFYVAAKGRYENKVLGRRRSS